MKFFALIALTASLSATALRLPTSGAALAIPTPAPMAPRQKVEGAITQANLQHNLDQINLYRSRAKVPALVLDPKLCDFAKQGSQELMKTHEPHGHFRKSDVWSSGFKDAAAENQGDPNGWFPGATDKTVDDILKAMMNEGPGGGHHDNMLSPAYKRLGVGLLKDSAGRLYLTNDFSG